MEAHTCLDCGVLLTADDGICFCRACALIKAQDGSITKNIFAMQDNMRDNGITLNWTSYIAQEIEGELNGHTVRAILNGESGYCSTYIGDKIIANLVPPYRVGESIQLERHVGIFG